MKAEELMHGDYVVYHGKLCKFLVRDYDAVLKRVDDGNEYPPCACREATPIPITTEILEKNGFVKRYEYWYNKRVRDNGVFDVSVNIDWKEIEITKIFGADTDCEETEYGLNIEYGEELLLHKFQQVLRTYNLYELADNFKI